MCTILKKARNSTYDPLLLARLVGARSRCFDTSLNGTLNGKG